MKLVYLWGFGVVLASGLSACDGDDAETSDPKCVELGARCHPFDHGSGLGHECHEIGHDNEVDQCHEKYDECLAFCTAPDAGTDAADAADAAEADPKCVELGALCHPFDNGSGLGHECHEIGHENDVEQCHEKYDECLAFCVAPDASSDAETTPPDASDLGDAGLLLCQEIGEKCHPFDAGLGHECHETGHAGDVAACAAVYDQCIDFCSSDAGRDH